MNLRPHLDADFDSIRELLLDNALPVADLEGAKVEFTVASDGKTIAGVIGLETFGDVGLLRSLAVRAAFRGQGLGEILLSTLEARAAHLGIHQLVLLTETASGYFTRHGYHAIERQHAPNAIQHSTEFRSLCPASAICMIKSLDKPGTDS